MALELPETYRAALAGLQDEMRAGVKELFGDALRVRWVKPEGIHLTLKFLGETPVARLDSLTTALSSAVPDVPAFSLSLGNVGSFEDRRAPRLVLATLSGETAQLFTLTQRIETWLAAAGWPRERRSFHPHLTLARLPEDLPAETRRALADLMRSFRTPGLAAWNIEAVSLMRSHLGPGGARYERIARFPA